MSQIDNEWYDELGAEWWNRRGKMRLLHEMNPARCGYFIQVLRRQRLAAGSSVLDVGCGGGLVSEQLARAGFSVTGLDLSPSSIRVAQDHARQSGLAIDYRVGPAEQLPFEDSTFDAVVSSDFLEHVSDRLERVLGEMARVLKPNGLLLYDTINRSPLARLIVIWGGRVAAIVAGVPPDAHAWPLLIKPAELTSALRQAGIQPHQVRGLSPALPPWRIPLQLLTTGEVGGFKISRDLRVSYIGWGQKTV